MRFPFFTRAVALSGISAVRPADGAQKRADLARHAADELRAAPQAKRVRIAKKAGMPDSCARLGPEAGPLLALLIDDDTLRPDLGDRAVKVWLSLDRPACVAHALARADEWQPATLWAL